MAQIVNTNVASLNAQRNLSNTQNALGTTLERLSSGLRINSGKDDAAGLAISNRMTAQIRGMNQAVRNTADGISLAQTAEGALQQVTDNLQRIRELAVQSANATNSASDRAALNQEVQQRMAEIDRVASQTAFNGKKVLDGTFGNATFQVGANVGETIAVGLDTSTRTSALGAVATATSGDLSGVISEGTPGTADSAASYTTGAIGSFDFSGVAAGGSVAFTPSTADFSGTPANFEVDGVAVSLTTDLTDANGVAAEIASQLGAGYTAVNDAGEITITSTTSANAVVISGADGGATGAGINDATGTAGTVGTVGFEVNGNAVSLDGDYASLAGLVSEIQNQLDALADGDFTVSAVGGTVQIATTATGDAATITVGTFSGIGQDLFAGGTTVAGADGDPEVPAASLTLAEGDFSIQVGDGAAVAVTGTFTSVGALADQINAQVAGVSASVDDDGQLVLNAAETITLAGTEAQGDLAFAALEHGASGSLVSVNVLDVAAANDALLRIDAALDSVNTVRGTLGAIQNRFESTIASLSVAVENVSAARSRILDADFAAETAELTRVSILQQAGISVLAQANALPQTALALLN